MVERMKYINIIGHLRDLDRVIHRYIYGYDIQFEDACKQLEGTEGLSQMSTKNPYEVDIKKIEPFAQLIDLKSTVYPKISEEKALQVIHDARAHYDNLEHALVQAEEKREEMRRFLNDIKPFLALDLRFEDMAVFEFIKYRYGRMPAINFKQFEIFLQHDKSILFINATGAADTDGYVYGLHFVTAQSKEVVDSLLASFQFERLWIPYELGGELLYDSPQRVFNKIEGDIQLLTENIAALHHEALTSERFTQIDLVAAYYKIHELNTRYELRKLAAKTQKDFYIFVGWMTEDNAKTAERELTTDPYVLFITEEYDLASRATPPTKLKNSSLIRPFELFVKMYGLPAYNEIDPTLLLALTYMLFFGMMFGDVGQGAVLALGGFYFYKARGVDLGAIIGSIGLSSILFGFMYGSVFGVEHWIPGIWMRPSQNILKILLITLGMGILLVFTAMTFNIINAARQRNMAKLLLGPNGAAGLVFYACAVYLGLIWATGSSFTYWPVFVVMLVSVMLIFLHKPITDWTSYGAIATEGRPYVYVFEMFVGMFEILLSYFTNTISFVRVGAFALSHAGVMSVVLLLSEKTQGSAHIAVLVVGNIIVIALEGLVAGIQALRLDFYEVFSRFFEGGGREYVPYRRNYF